MAPSVSPASTHYALVVDAGSSGSRLQIYSWRDPDLERAEILQEVRQARDAGESSSSKKKWWWKASDALLGKGKGKAQDQMERRALRRLVRVGKGVEGDAWVKRVEPGEKASSRDSVEDWELIQVSIKAYPQYHQMTYQPTWPRCSHMPYNKYRPHSTLRPQSTYSRPLACGS